MSDFVIDFRKSRREKARYRNTGKNGVRIGTAYFSGVRPMETGGSIVDDLIWRRTEANKPPLSNKEMLKLVQAKFVPYWVKLEKVFWNRRAGCNCGCSPGYILYGSIDSEGRNQAIDWKSRWYFNPQGDEFNVWVSTVEYEREQEIKQLERAAAKAEEAKAALVGAGI